MRARERESQAKPINLLKRLVSFIIFAQVPKEVHFHVFLLYWQKQSHMADEVIHVEKDLE